MTDMQWLSAMGIVLMVALVAVLNIWLKRYERAHPETQVEDEGPWSLLNR